MFRTCVPTFMTIAEDMSYNHGPMISKRTFDEFVAPYYRALLPRLQECGIPLFMDTDGDVTLLVPWLEELGVQGVLPLERQAKVDGLKLHRQFPRLGYSEGANGQRSDPRLCQRREPDPSGGDECHADGAHEPP